MSTNPNSQLPHAQREQAAVTTPSTEPPFVGTDGSRFQLELVGSDGQPILQRPVDVDELLRQHQYSLPIGSGVTVRLEEYNQDDAQHAGGSSTSSSSEYDDEGEGENTDDDDRATEDAEDGTVFRPHHAPPGTREVGGWYDVLNELRHERQVDVAARAREKGFSAPGSQVRSGRAVAQLPPPHKRGETDGSARPVATPMKLFPTARPPGTSARSRSLEATQRGGDKAGRAAALAGKSSSNPQARREVWASFAPPADPETNYKHMEYVSVMNGVDSEGAAVPCRHFRPSALSFPATASYLNAKDNGQRVLVYGGVSSAGVSIQKELYEFSSLTGHWRRLEGRQFVPAGHMGHAMAVVESVDRLIVVGGVGPCGGSGGHIRAGDFADDAVRAMRAHLFFPEELTGKAKGLIRSPSPQRIGAKAPAPAVGFVPLLFDMSLSDQRWRAIQPAQPFPLAFHTAVPFGDQIYVFGGLTEEMVVSGQLIAIDVATYALRLVQPADRHNPPRRPRRQRVGGDDAADSTDDERDDAEGGEEEEGHFPQSAEAQGPGPRFLHSAIRYGNYMVVYGGFDARNEARSDTWAFDLVNERWERLPCHGDAPARAGHTASLVGSRMIVVGGFACSLEESANSGEGEEVGGPTTEQIVMELNLVPTMRGEHLWRQEVKTHPPLPPLVFGASAPCGDDSSLLVFGGLTKHPKFKAGKSTAAGGKSGGPRHRSLSRTNRRGAREERKRGRAGRHAEADSDDDDDAPASTPYLRQLITLDDAFVMTFPVKKRSRKRDDEDAPHVNELGVEVDPNEMPEHFKTFMRRQEDFLKKKEAAALATQKKMTLDEQEAMEPTIYLTEEEIARALEKSEELCATFVSYKMDSLPGNVPDRERRIQIIENCVSLSRQVRDVVRSMKGSQVAVTAVKSKSHRRRAGQKFEDFSAAKPFRRVVIASLVEEINEELAVMHRLNRALRTVEWEEKDAFKDAIQSMQDTVHSFSNTSNAIMSKYVNRRVEKLMKGVDRHKETMRLLTEVVERNRDDKLWDRDEARDKKRAGDKAKQDRADRQEVQGGKRKGRTPVASPQRGTRRAASTRHRSTGAGYHANEGTATVHVMDKDWQSLMDRAGQLERSAKSLEELCHAGLASSVLLAAAQAVPAPPAQAALSVALPSAPPVAVPPPPPAPPEKRDDSTSDSDSDAPPPPATAAAPLPSSAALQTPAASPKETLIRRSNANRERVMAAAQRVGEAAKAFREALEKEDVITVATPAPDGSRSQSAEAPPPPAAEPVPVAPPLVAGPTTAATPQAHNARASSSNGSSSSSSSSGVASPVPPAPAAVTASLALPQPPSLPAQAPEPSLPPQEDHPPPPRVETTQPKSNEPHAAGVAPHSTPAEKAVAPAGYHTLHLSALRPLLELREELDKTGERVAQIRENEWDGTDLSAAPPDTRLERRYKRVRSILLGLIQSITASFLSAAGAKRPRQRPAAKAVAAPPSQRTVSKRAAHRSASKSSKAPAAAETALIPGASGAAVGEEAERAVSQGRDVRPLRSASPHNGQQRSRHLLDSPSMPPPLPDREPAPGVSPYRLSKLNLSPRTRFSELSQPGATAAPAGKAGDGESAQKSREGMSSPLLSEECCLKAQEPPAAVRAAAAGGDAAAPGASFTADRRMVVEVSAIAPQQTVIKCSLAEEKPYSPKYSWRATSAGATTDTQRPVISVAPGPTLAVPSTAGPSRTTAAAGSRPAAPAGAATSIEDFTRMTAAGSGAGVAALTEQPATSIAPGPFVVNPEYFHSINPAAAAAPVAASSGRPTRTHWADAEEDYFYFGRQQHEARPAGALSPPAGLPTEAASGGVVASVPSRNVTVSPAVGTVLGSQRVNAALVEDGNTRSAGRRRGMSSAAAATARPGRMLIETTNTLARPDTSRSAKEDIKKRLTPGELQILQGRERLRRRQ